MTLAPLVIVSMLALTLTSTIPAPVWLADNTEDALTALMIGGAWRPTAGADWIDAAICDYIDPATGRTDTCRNHGADIGLTPREEDCQSHTRRA